MPARLPSTGRFTKTTERRLTFELEDSRGNRVFKKVNATDGFGVASAEFSLADEVNLGAYHLRALMGESSAPSDTAELTLNVERYVLPKFKVAIEFTRRTASPDATTGRATTSPDGCAQITSSASQSTVRRSR